MKRIFLITLAGVLVNPGLICQVIWSENFSGYANCTTTGANNNTVNPAPDWTTTNADTDDGAITCSSGQSFWGTFNGEFRINDIEGPLTTCGTGGSCENFITTETIDISSYPGAAISVDVRYTGTMETGALVHCDNATDIVHLTYSLDGGPFTQFSTNGFLTGNFSTPVTSSQPCLLGGSTLVIRIQAGNKANTENFFIDNIMVEATSCPLPVELAAFYLSCDENNNLTANWTTVSETNNSHFMVQGSKDAIYYNDVVRVEGNGNSNQTIDYSILFNNENNYLYFRLIQVDLSGLSKNYNPVFINCGHPVEGLNIKVNNNSINLSAPANLPGETKIMLADTRGHTLCTHQLHHYKNNTPVSIEIPAYIAQGVYMVTVFNAASGKYYYAKLFIQ